MVAADRSELKRILKEIEETRKLFTAPLHKLKTALDAFFNTCALPFKEVDQVVDRKILEFRERQREAAAAEQARLQREAEERHRKEQEAWEAAEKVRKAAEAKAAAEAAKKGKNGSLAPLPVVPPTPPPPPPVATPAPVVPPPPKSVAGMSFREVWEVEVVDFVALEDAYKLPNMTLLQEVVRKKGVREIPGCRIFKKEVSVTRT